jgi:hypothetical protein
MALDRVLYNHQALRRTLADAANHIGGFAMSETEDRVATAFDLASDLAHYLFLVSEQDRREILEAFRQSLEVNHAFQAQQAAAAGATGTSRPS